jgi:nicotinamidase-related amidase
MKNTALLLIEMQNDYFPNGRMQLEKSTDACQKVQEVLQICRTKQLPAIYLQHYSTHPDATHFLPGTKGVELHASIQPTKNETVIKKHYPNGFKDTALLMYLVKNQINHLVIAGMMTHMAVEATVRAAYDLGISCTVLSDACATMNLDFNSILIPAQTVHYAFLAALQPMYANVVSTREYLQLISAKSSIGA